MTEEQRNEGAAEREATRDELAMEGDEQGAQELDSPEAAGLDIPTVPAQTGTVPVSVDSMTVDAKARAAAGEGSAEEGAATESGVDTRSGALGVEAQEKSEELAEEQKGQTTEEAASQQTGTGRKSRKKE